MSSAPLSAPELPPPATLAAIATMFIDCYARGDRAGMLALCAADAAAEYVPWGAEGPNPLLRAVEVWARYPAAFDGFAMPITATMEDPARRVVVIGTMNQGRQRADVDGISNAGSEMRCPHLFVLGFDPSDRIASVQV